MTEVICEDCQRVQTVETIESPECDACGSQSLTATVGYDSMDSPTA